MTNIKCQGGKEIDLLAINPKTGEKYHVETRVSLCRSLALKEKDTYTSKGRANRRGLDYFAKEKFNHPIVVKAIHKLFGDSNYRKFLVAWCPHDSKAQDNFLNLSKLAKEKYGFQLVDFKVVLDPFIKFLLPVGRRDDILRTMEIIALMRREGRASIGKPLRDRIWWHHNLDSNEQYQC
jgi:hypothetical protein